MNKMSGEHIEPSTQRVTLGRSPERGRYDFPSIAAILDAGLACHVGFISDNQPIVIPTIYGRIGSNLYLHSSAVARWMNELKAPAQICVTVSILDALVLARSAYQHTLNYRSVVVLGQAKPVVDAREKLAALRAILEHVCAGRWKDVRPPTDGELRATLVLRVAISEASAKVRSGPAIDFASDLASDAWAGLIPLRICRATPIPDPDLADHISLPPYCIAQ